MRRLDLAARVWGRRGSPGNVWLSSYQRRNEAEAAEHRTIKRRLQRGYAAI
jgi:predicted DNA-binding WGR domain protein